MDEKSGQQSNLPWWRYLKHPSLALMLTAGAQSQLANKQAVTGSLSSSFIMSQQRNTTIQKCHYTKDSHVVCTPEEWIVVLQKPRWPTSWAATLMGSAREEQKRSFFFYVRAAAHKAACHTTARQPQSFFLPTCKERILCAFHIWRILWTRKLSLSPFQALCRHEPFLKNFKAQLLSDSQCPRQPWQSVSTLPPRNNRTHKHRLFPADSQLLTSPCAELRVNLRQGSPGLLTTPKSRPSLETSYTAQQAAIQVRLKVGIPSCDFTRAHAWIWYRPVILSVRQTREICLLGYTLVKQSSAGCNNEWLSAVQPLHTNARGSWSPTAAGRQHVKAAFRHETPQMPSGEPAKAPTAASQTNTSLLQCEISQGRCVTWSAAM